MLFVTAILHCIVISAIFVINIYLFTPKGNNQRFLPRNNPKTVVRRMIGVIFSCLTGFFYTWVVSDHKNIYQLFSEVGIISSQPVYFLPILLALSLFLGPTVGLIISDGFIISENLGSVYFWRAYVLSPLAEEFVFRSCVITILLQGGASNNFIIYYSPFFFGLAHLHHAYELYFNQNNSLTDTIALVVFQFSYTTIFGWLVSFVFLETKSFLTVVLLHSFCNSIGFPDFSLLISENFLLVSSAYLIGFLLFTHIASTYGCCSW
jgi:prenyl protein peptidase